MHAAFISVPVDLHPVRVIAGMPLRHEILVPRTEDFGIGGTGGRAFPPDLGRLGGERGVDYPSDRLTQRIFLDKTAAHIKQMRVTDPPRGGDHPFQTGIGAEAIETPQQPWLSGLVVEDFAGGEARERFGKPDAQISFLRISSRLVIGQRRSTSALSWRSCGGSGCGSSGERWMRFLPRERSFTWGLLGSPALEVARRRASLAGPCDEGLSVCWQM